MTPAEPCGVHALPPHHRHDASPYTGAVPYFKFQVSFRLVESGKLQRWTRWAPGVLAFEDAAWREMLGRYGPWGVQVDSVCFGVRKARPKAKAARLGLFDPR